MSQSNRFFLLFLCLFLMVNVNGQTTETFTNDLPISTDDTSIDFQYPSLMNVSGMDPFTSSVTLEFPEIRHDSDFSEFDIVLESPSGFRSLIFSDGQHISSVQVLWGMRVGSTGSDIYDPDNPTSFNLYAPYNVESPDVLPIIGSIEDVQNTVFPFENTDPNGTWKLYFHDDTDNSNHGQLPQGWKLILKSKPNPVCVRPEIPTLDEVIDTSAFISWNSFGQTTNWDIAYGESPFTAIFSTVPNFDNATNQNGFEVSGLNYDTNYDLYIRSDCAGDDSDATNWIGPLNFNSGPSICNNAITLESCNEYNFSSSNAYQQDGFELACPNGTQATNKWIVEFTPTVNSSYFLGTNNLVESAMIRPKENICSLDGWNCIFDGTKNIPLGLLNIGTTYQVYLISNSSFSAKINECEPVGEIEMDQAQPLVFESTSQFSVNGILINGNFDIVLNLTGATPPDDNSIPFYSNYQITNGILEFPNPSLEDDTEYEIYLREKCALGEGCWQGPFEFETYRYCGDIPPLTINPNSISADISIFNPMDGFISINFGAAPYPQPTNATPASTDIYGSNGGTIDSLRMTLLNLVPNTDYQFYVQRNCNGGGGSDDAQEWMGPYSFTTDNTCFVEVQDLMCGICYTAPPNYGYDFFSTATSCDFSGVPSHGERIFKIQSPTTGIITLDYLQSNGVGANSAIYQFYLKSASEICDLENWVEIGCWKKDAATDIDIPVEADSVYYLLLDYKTNSTFQPVSHSFSAVGSCGSPCDPVDTVMMSSIDATSVLVSWPSTIDAIAYDIYLHLGSNIPDCVLGNPIQPNAAHPDTFYIFENLTLGQDYFVSVRAKCSELNYSAWETITVNTQTTVSTSFSNNNTLEFCSPFYAREENGSTNLYSYDELSIEVTASGVYQFSQIMDGGSYLALYNNSFDSENPTIDLQNFISSEEISTNELLQLYQLEMGQTYTVVSTRKNQSLNASQIDLTITGTGDAISDGYFYQGKRKGASGIIPPTNGTNYASNKVCIDIEGWRHYFQTDNTNLTMNQNLLLFSIEDYPEIYNGTLRDTLALGGETGVSVIPFTDDNYVQDMAGWTTMNRYWYLDLPEPTIQQPVLPVGVRFYYTEADFTAMQNAAPSSIDHSDLYFHKINSANNNYNIDPTSGHTDIPAALECTADGLWEYANGIESDTIFWKYGSYESDHFAEMKVHSFSGGGGGVGSPFAIINSLDNPGQAKEMNWMVFPNPTKDFITIKSENGQEAIHQVRIYDTNGKVVLQSLGDGNLNRMELSLKKLSPALYFVKIIGAENTRILRVVKE